MGQDDHDNKEQSGAGSSEGKSATPTPSKPDTEHEEPTKEIPVGSPVSPEEFRRLKKRAQEADEAASDEGQDQGDDSEDKDSK